MKQLIYFQNIKFQPGEMQITNCVCWKQKKSPPLQHGPGGEATHSVRQGFWWGPRLGHLGMEVGLGPPSASPTYTVGGWDFCRSWLHLALIENQNFR